MFGESPDSGGCILSCPPKKVTHGARQEFKTGEVARVQQTARTHGSPVRMMSENGLFFLTNETNHAHVEAVHEAVHEAVDETVDEAVGETVGETVHAIEESVP